MKTLNLKIHVAIILAVFAAVFFAAGCGSSEAFPEDRAYISDRIESGYTASVYTFDAKEGIASFGSLDPENPVKNRFKAW